MNGPHSNGSPFGHERGLDAVIAGWVSDGSVRACLATDRSLEGAPARLAPLPPLPEGLVRALAARGIGELYTHQRKAIDAATSGSHVLIATPTASGKSLCFHLPVLSALAEDASATALFLYPTKALSRDQEHGLHALMKDSGIQVPSIVFDGDTPGDVRQKARERGRIILTNPDMLHSGILPNHPRWATFFRGLRYVVLDEMHTYRGVFGSHMAHVIARLTRIARFHGANPTFIGATATIGNPKELGSRLLGVPETDVTLVNESGAPECERRVFIYNPPIVNQELGVRASTLKAAVRLARDLVLARVPTIVFAPSRNSVEVMLKYLREATEASLRGSRIDPNTAIMGYRGGYLPEMRRRIERGLRDGQVLCVVATNALELGIDIGDLDAVVCAGYPGSVAGTWQRFGRAGRRGKQSALVLVCGSGAVDQYLAREPEYLLERSAEQALIDPANAEILIQHLKCALFEAPFTTSSPGPRPASPEAPRGEAYAGLDLQGTQDALEYLAQNGVAHVSGGRYHYAGEAFPASHVSLRSIGWDNFVIIDQGTETEPQERTIGELDYRATHTMLHEQAIYQQDAEQYQVERLDFDNHKAYVRKVAPDYFTTALTYRSVTLLDRFDERRTEALAPSAALARSAALADASAFEPASLVEGWGDVKVVEKVTGYKKIKFFTHENSGYGDVHLPPMEMHTTSYFLTVPEALLATIDAPRPLLVDALRGLGRALETTATLALMCDPRDINQTLGDGEPPGDGAASSDGREPVGPSGRDREAGHVGLLDPTLFLFDAQPGGVGLAERIFQRASELWARTEHHVAECPCPAGCPACIGPVEDESTGSGRKSLALELVRRINEHLSPTLH